ncbi:hypothetical protein M9Y10_012102 [Tritrichomonas musculus]|uniref:Uncharacterized protein n=1 Tax=Tritrichomonas musculus TaxID=1915356 RepID=A0ABR2ICE1_9EUKA
MEVIIKQNENSLKKVQGLKANLYYDKALVVCNKILDNLKPIALQEPDITDDIQLMAITIGEISEIYEKKKELQYSLQYKKVQRRFLSYLKSQNSILIEEPYEMNDSIRSKKDLINKLDEIREMTISLSNNPEDAMNQILESLQRSKEKRVKSALESIVNSQNKNDKNKNDIELTKFERFIEFIFNHPILFALFVILVFSCLIFYITTHFRTEIEVSKNTKERIKKISNHISNFNNIKPQPKVKNHNDL